MEKNNKPQVRFKGFNEEWKERELSKILSERKVLQKISADAPILAFAAGQGVIDRSQRKSNNRDHLTHDQENKVYKLTELNDIVYNPSNLKYGAIDRNKHGRGVISPIYVTFTTEEEPSFVELIVKSEKFKLRALQYEEGTVVKRQSVKPENLLSLKVYISNSKDEQKKIGILLQNLDKLITERQRKQSKLKVLKKAMLAKMFTQQGQIVPEIRFKGFTGDWDETIISEVAEVSTGYAFDSKLFNQDGEYLVITNGNIQNELAFVDVSYGNRIDINTSLEHYVLNIDDILVTMDGTVGRTAKTSKTKQILAQRVGRLKAYTDPEFLYQLLNTGNFFKEMTLLSTGGTIKHISLSNISNYKLLIPSDEEEKKMIGNYFKNIDNLIDNLELQINKLQNLKRAFLNKMFI